MPRTSPHPRADDGAQHGRVRRVSGSLPRGRATRQEIIEAATSAFGREGYRDASLRAIADAVNLSQAGLLHHFPTKSSLLMAVLDERDAMVLRTYESALDRGESQCSAVVRVIERQLLEHRDLVAMLVVVSAEATSPAHPGHERLVERRDRLVAVLEGEFRRFREQGRLRDGVVPQDAAQSVAALIDGLLAHWVLKASDPDGRVDVVGLLRSHLDRILTSP